MTPRPTPEECIAAACQATGVTYAELFDTRHRKGMDSVCRRIAAILMRLDSRMSYPAIAQQLGLASHASVHRAVNVVGVNSDEQVCLEMASAIAIGKARRRLQAWEAEA